MSTDLALAADPSVVEAAADPGEYIVQCCERGKWWLKAALERDDLEAVLEAKAQAEAIRVYTISKGYGADAKLSAEEIIRRAERGLALATRIGQENGEINTRSDGGWKARDLENTGNKKKSPSEYVGNGQARVESYAMADDVSDEDFEEALEEARAEENLSRRNVARRARARAQGAPPAPAGQAVSGRPRSGRASRRPLPDFANETGWDLRKTIEKLERIFADDRFRQNESQVAMHLHGHLAYAVKVCQDLLDRLNQTEGV